MNETMQIIEIAYIDDSIPNEWKHLRGSIVIEKERENTDCCLWWW